MNDLPNKQDFDHLTDWVFDLDNTLYPRHQDLFGQIDARMTDYVARLTGLPRAEARILQKQLYRDHGTTLAGLMAEYEIDPHHYLAEVHDIDYSAITANSDLGTAIAALPGRKHIFTNGDRAHAEKTLAALGIPEIFDSMFDIVAAGFDPKPRRIAYERFVEAHAIDASRAIMFEDMARNLEVPKQLGMKTVLIVPHADSSHSAEVWELDGHDGGHVHVDHVTDTLHLFLILPLDVEPANGRSRFTSVEARIDRAAHRVLDGLPKAGIYGSLVEFLVFGLKQAWACAFGGAMLALIIATRLWYPEGAAMARYDFLFACAIAIQAAMLAFRLLEKPSEATVIAIFHVIGTAMEVFKIHAGSWTYPEESVMRIGAVPLFSGFMYAAVGSYIARIGRIFDMRYSRYPPIWTTIVLAVAIYVNFFSHHYIVDLRLPIFAAAILLYARTQVHYRVFRHTHRMPLLLGFGLVALFIWLAENMGTISRAWLYPEQAAGWVPVSPAKLGSWYLLMIISFVLVTLVHRPRSPGNEMGNEQKTRR